MTRVERGEKMPIYSPHAEHIGIASYTTVGSNIYPPRGDRRGFANSLAKKAAFTLGEVLIAIAVVGVIAGLVLPSVVNHFQTKTLASAQTRLQDTLQDSVKSLTVTENAEDIRQTMLYVPDDTSLDGLSDFSDSSVKFMNKYLKISKMCDSSTIGKECFAPYYWQYEGGQKKTYTPQYSNKYKNACATLKNGMSVCMRPSSKDEQMIKVLADLNGRKEPNVFGRDLVEFELNPFVKPDRIVRRQRTLDDTVVIEIKECLPSNMTWPACCDVEHNEVCCEQESYKLAHPKLCSTEENPCDDLDTWNVSCCLNDANEVNSEYFNHSYGNQYGCCSAYGDNDGPLKSVCCAAFPDSTAYCETPPPSSPEPKGTLSFDQGFRPSVDKLLQKNDYFFSNAQLKKVNLKYAYRITINMSMKYNVVPVSAGYVDSSCEYPAGWLIYKSYINPYYPSYGYKEPPLTTSASCCVASYSSYYGVWEVGLNDGSSKNSAPKELHFPCRGGYENTDIILNITTKLERSKDGTNWEQIETCTGYNGISTCGNKANVVED